MLDIAFDDRDLEQLAGILNEHYAKQRCVVADALRQESNLKESIANISHDLRTPLTVIIGHTGGLICLMIFFMGVRMLQMRVISDQ